MARCLVLRCLVCFKVKPPLPFVLGTEVSLPSITLGYFVHRLIGIRYTVRWTNRAQLAHSQRSITSVFLRLLYITELPVLSVPSSRATKYSALAKARLASAWQPPTTSSIQFPKPCRSTRLVDSRSLGLLHMRRLWAERS